MMPEVAESKTEGDNCVTCSKRAMLLEVLSEMGDEVVSKFRLKLFRSIEIAEILTPSSSVIAPFPDDLEFQISGEDLNMFSYLMFRLCQLSKEN